MLAWQVQGSAGAHAQCHGTTAVLMVVPGMMTARTDRKTRSGEERVHKLSLVFDAVDQCMPHEVATLRFAAGRLAVLLGMAYDEADASPGANVGSYCIPMSTLSFREANALRISDESQLWGGIAPHEFVATKLVSHPLWRSGSERPSGWKHIAGIEMLTLPGYSVFTRDDAWSAGRYLLQEGTVRVKCPFMRGGNGQARIRDVHELDRWLDAADEVPWGDGLVLERDLVQSKTYSIGSSNLPGYAIAYQGTQRNVMDGQGNEVYGGSTLTVFRGSFSTLIKEHCGEPVAVATAYDSLVRGTYGVLASRRNYDVIVGVDSCGKRHVGVLEQSWRFGGASMAEVLALEWLQRHPGRNDVVAETVELYGAGALPDNAVVFASGGGGSPRKYARIVPDGY